MSQSKLNKAKLKDILDNEGKSIRDSFKGALVSNEEWEGIKKDFESALLQYINSGDKSKLNSLISSKINECNFEQTEFFDLIGKTFCEYMIRSNDSDNKKPTSSSKENDIDYEALGLENPHKIVEQGNQNIAEIYTINEIIDKGHKASKDVIKEMKENFEEDMKGKQLKHQKEIESIGKPKDSKKPEEQKNQKAKKSQQSQRNLKNLNYKIFKKEFLYK